MKRSQTSLLEIHNAMSRHFDVRRMTRGRHEWIEGDLKIRDDLGKQDPTDYARIYIKVPYDEKSNRTITTRMLSHFSGTLYEMRLHNLDLSATLTVIRGLQDLGDVGFVSTGPTGGGRNGGAIMGERVFIWPEGRDAQLTKASELHQGYREIQESIMANEKPEPETPPYKLCGGIPSGELCPRCKYNILKGGKQYCDKYHKCIAPE